MGDEKAPETLKKQWKEAYDWLKGDESPLKSK